MSISVKAIQEDKLRTELQKLEDAWKGTSFTIEIDEKTETPILVKLDDIYTVLDESLAAINMVLGSRFVAPLRSEADNWRKWIFTINEMID